MSLKPQAPREMPAELAALGAQLLPRESPYRLVGEVLYAKYKDEDYADLYPAEGQPGLSPVDLAFVTAYQFLEDLPDRAAAAAVRLRLDWKYALHLPLGYTGFNFSVLSEYRARLIAHGAEARVFEALLADLVTLGLLKRRGRQRTDSLAVLSRVRTLTRTELVVETLRLAVQALGAADAGLGAGDPAAHLGRMVWGALCGRTFDGSRAAALAARNRVGRPVAVGAFSVAGHACALARVGSGASVNHGVGATIRSARTARGVAGRRVLRREHPHPKSP